MSAPYPIILSLFLSAAFTISINPEAATGEPRKIALIPIGEVDVAVLRNLAPPLEERFGLRIEVGGSMPRPERTYNLKRRQYLAEPILYELRKFKTRGIMRVLGVADFDLYAPGLNFVFGQADTVGGVAIMSLARLKQEFYGMPGDEALFNKRAIKEAVHELGHTFGLDHCDDRNCVMFFSNSLADTDRKSDRFCPRHQEQIENLSK